MSRKTYERPGLLRQDVERKAKKLLPHLLPEGTHMAKSPQSPDRQTEGYRLYGRDDRPLRPALKIEKEYVEAFLSRGWIERSHGQITLSEAGRAWLRRIASGCEPFREQHQSRSTELREIVPGTRRPVLVNEAESPLGWLRKRKDRNGNPLIDDYQFEAGERLRKEFTMAQLNPSVTANWSLTASSKRTKRASPNDAAGMSINALAAKERVIRALETVGPELSGILIDICCHLQGLEEAEKGHGWPQRSGKVVLQLALTRLARHYGLIECSKNTKHEKRQTAHWGGSGYRPSLDAWHS